jgi:LysR family transcriptional regulator, nod-box dependent transcriptional activator
MRFKGLDLNLLVALDVLLEERSVSRAAERLHLSQPSASAALARLREYFNDPLLESQGKRMIPTAFALRLRPLLADVLGDVDRMLGQARRFEPATSTRWFRIAVSDYLVAVLFPRLVRLVQEQAPDVRLDLQAPTDSTLELIERGEIDMLLTPQEHCARDHPMELLFEERFVVAGWDGNPVFDGPMTEDLFYAAGHVVTAMGQVDRASFGDDRLHARGRERRVEIVAFSFTQVPDLLVGTRRLSLMHERLARSMAERYPIRFCNPPFDFPAMREMAQFHRSRAADPGLQWLLARLREAAAG